MDNPSGIHWGHFGVVLTAMVLLLGVSWMKNPELFSFNKTNAQPVSEADVPQYYAYVQPPEDTQPLVAGASTNQGPGVISDDGSNNVLPVDNTGQVLGASTQDVQLPLENIKVNPVADSDAAIKKYLTDSRKIEIAPIDNAAFEAALSSGNQQSINLQSQQLISIRDSLQKLLVPAGLVKFQQLKIAQYNAAIGVLQNFTQADQNPQLVGDYLQQFLKSQQDLQTETSAVAQKYNLDPSQLSVGQIDTQQLTAAQSTDQSASGQALDQQTLNQLGNNNVGQ